MAATGGLLNRGLLAGLFCVLGAALPLLAEEPGPRLRVDEPVFAGALFTPGASFSHEFILRNEGRAPLLIEEARTGCSCAVAAYDRTIAPGGQGRVRLSVDVYREWAGRDILRTVWLTTNDPEAAQVSLTVRGRVDKTGGPPAALP